MSDSRYYDSIGIIPLFNWRKCSAGDLTFTRVNPKVGNKKADAEAWKTIYNTYIAKYGLPEGYDTYIELQKKLALAQLDVIETDVRFKMNKVDLLQVELDKLTEQTDDGKDYYSSALTALRKWMGQWITDKKITAEDFFDTLNDYNEYVQKQNDDAPKVK